MKNQNKKELTGKVSKENIYVVSLYESFMHFDCGYSFLTDYFWKVHHITIRFQENEIQELQKFKKMELANPSLYNDDLIYLIALMEGSQETNSELIPLPFSEFIEYISYKQRSGLMFNSYYYSQLSPSMEKVGYQKIFSPNAPDFENADREKFLEDESSDFWDGEHYRDYEKIYIVNTKGDKCFAPGDLPVYSIDEYNEQLLALGRSERLIIRKLHFQPEHNKSLLKAINAA